MVNLSQAYRKFVNGMTDKNLGSIHIRAADGKGRLKGASMPGDKSLSKNTSDWRHACLA